MRVWQEVIDHRKKWNFLFHDHPSLIWFASSQERWLNSTQTLMTTSTLLPPPPPSAMQCHLIGCCVGLLLGAWTAGIEHEMQGTLPGGDSQNELPCRAGVLIYHPYKWWVCQLTHHIAVVYYHASVRGGDGYILGNTPCLQGADQCLLSLEAQRSKVQDIPGQVISSMGDAVLAVIRVIYSAALCFTVWCMYSGVSMSLAMWLYPQFFGIHPSHSKCQGFLQEGRTNTPESQYNIMYIFNTVVFVGWFLFSPQPTLNQFAAMK